MKRYLLLILLGMITMASKAQQYPMISQYMFNGLLLNPAYAGNHTNINSTLHHRSQWVGFEGAPRTSILSVDGMLPNDKSALGGIIYHDRIGSTTETDVSANYAYHLKTGGNTNIAFGLRGGFSYLTTDMTSLNTWDADNVFLVNTSMFIPKAGFGAFFYADNYYAGFSIPTLLAFEPDHRFSLDVSKASTYHRHYFLSGGYVYTINDNYKIRPSVLLKYLPNAPVQADLNANLLINNFITTGISYRTGESIIALLEYQTELGIRLGYSFDYSLSKIRNFSYGSHEVMIGYRFQNKKPSKSGVKFY